jgi:glycosyltransferase involved in cell wall biosynthesis
MNVVFLRTKFDSTVFLGDRQAGDELDASLLERMKITQKAGSSSKNMIVGLIEKRLVSRCEEWKFWNGRLQEISGPGHFPVKLFPADERFALDELAHYIDAAGQPDILWVEGTDYPFYLERIFQLCPESFKLVYSKDWRPWKIERLEEYDLCLVDEPWEVEKVRSRYPHLHCAVWDKLIDYESAFYPIASDKIYDICYVAYLRERKNHALLFSAMAKIKDRRLSCVCIGDDRKNHRAELEKMITELPHSVHFTGEIPFAEVNRYINSAKIGVMCSRLDAAPRAILEYMAADAPVLVNSELLAGARYVGAQAGLVKPPAEFHLGILELLDNYQNYSPRAFFLENYSAEKVVPKFIEILEQAGCR